MAVSPRLAGSVPGDNYPERRIASPEMLPSADLLPHVICYPPVFAGGGEHEVYQHDDA